MVDLGIRLLRVGLYYRERITTESEEQRMRIGEIHFTGNEESGACWLCGGVLPKRRRRWCCDEHMTQYWGTYNYSYASGVCMRRTENTCENCHKSHSALFKEIRERTEPGYCSSYTDAQIEVHHIIPLEGEPREWNVLNRQDNLTALCHQCHLQAHASMRQPTPKKVRDKQEVVKVKKYGQLDLL